MQGSVQELKRAVFRGGTTLLGAAEQKAEFILSGGTAHLADGLAEGSTVEGGAGVFSAQSFSGAAVNDYGAVLWDGADGSAYRGVYGAGYYPTDYSPDWAGTVPSAVWDALNAENPYENDWFAGTLTWRTLTRPSCCRGAERTCVSSVKTQLAGLSAARACSSRAAVRSPQAS